VQRILASQHERRGNRSSTVSHYGKNHPRTATFNHYLIKSSGDAARTWTSSPVGNLPRARRAVLSHTSARRITSIQRLLFRRPPKIRPFYFTKLRAPKSGTKLNPIGLPTVMSPAICHPTRAWTDLVIGTFAPPPGQHLRLEINSPAAQRPHNELLTDRRGNSSPPKPGAQVHSGVSTAGEISAPAISPSPNPRPKWGAAAHLQKNLKERA